MISTIALYFAFVFFAIAAFMYGSKTGEPRIHLGWLGAAVWVLSVILTGR